MNELYNSCPTLWKLGKLALEDAGAATWIPTPMFYVNKTELPTFRALEAAIHQWRDNHEVMELLWDNYESVLPGSDRGPDNDELQPALDQLRKLTGIDDDTLKTLGDVVGRMFDGDLTGAFKIGRG